MNETNQFAISLTGLHKRFRTRDGVVEAVAGIDVEVSQGEIVAFLGPNGAGKTTTIDMVLGLTDPTAGRVRVLGTTPQRAVHAGRVSAVMQTGGLLRDLTVRETVRAIASLHGASHRVDEVMERTEITKLASRKVSKCSGGEQQRLKFALALLPDPDLLILDEPTAGMDVNSRREFWDTMRDDADSGRTVVFATHYLEEAEQFAQRTILIAGGRIVADGPTARIQSMVSGRTVSAALPDLNGDAEATVAAIRGFDGVTRVERNGPRISAVTTDSDALALALLRDHGAHDLQISAPSLENAFVHLTNGAAERPELQESAR
ncbi:ABC transporter ATP-binding protein [Tessaracoccus terricola]